MDKICEECINYCAKSSGYGYCGLHTIEVNAVSLCDQFDTPVKFKVIAMLRGGKFVEYGTYFSRKQADSICDTLRGQTGRFLRVEIEEI